MEAPTETKSAMIDILRLSITEKWEVQLVVHPVLIVLIAVGVIVAWALFMRKARRYEVVDVNVKIANIGEIKLRPNEEVAGIAHKAWAEIMTRKAGLAFDEEHDVIAEVYNSWYSLFGEFRNLIKSIPVAKLRSSPDAQKLLEFMVKALNEGLRPHLTRYQARFRKWFEEETKKTPSDAPQEIQRRYPEYAALVADLKRANTDMADFAAFLKQVATGKA